MKTINSYKKGWTISLNSQRMISLVYVIYLILALLLVIPFYSLFNSMVGSSLLPDQLMDGFSATAFGELLRDGGKNLAFFTKAMAPWLVLFFLLGTFLQGGIIGWISNNQRRFSSKSFVYDCIAYFWPFLKTSFYSLIIQVIIAVLIYLPVSILIGRDNLSDAYIGRTIIPAVAIHLILLIWVTMVAEFTRFHIFRSGNRKVLKSLWKSIKFSLRRIGGLFGMYLVWVVLPLALIITMYFVRKNWIIDTGLMIFLLLILQQVFIWLRFFLRIQKSSMFYNYLELVEGNA